MENFISIIRYFFILAEFQILTEEQCHQFLNAVSDSPYEALYYLVLIIGMRQGELLGLKWADLDWNRSILLVQRQLQRVEHEGVFLVPPKTRAGRRQIKLGQGILEKMNEHSLKQKKIKVSAGDHWQENDLVFPSTIGTPQDQYRLSYKFKKMIKHNGLPNIRCHDLRHTSISFLLEMGSPLNSVQRRGRTCQGQHQFRVYGHSMARSQEEAAERIDEMVLSIAVKLQSNKSYANKPGTDNTCTKRFDALDMLVQLKMWKLMTYRVALNQADIFFLFCFMTALSAEFCTRL